jgi:tetratricopeptide (TPR) repeat protein
VAARQTGSAESPIRAQALLERREQLIDAADDDPRRIENDIDHAHAGLPAGEDPARIEQSLRDAERRAAAIDDPRLRSKALAATCWVLRKHQAFDEAREVARKAVEAARRADAPRALIYALSELGWVEQGLGHLDRAERHRREVYRLASDEGDHLQATISRANRAWIALARGDDRRARDLFEAVLEESRRDGLPSLTLDCINGLGDLAYFAGDAERAREYQHRMRRLGRETGRPISAPNSHLNLAIVEVMDGRFERGAEHLGEARSGLETLSHLASNRHVVRLIELALAAGTGNWSTLDDRFAPYADGWPDDSRCTRDHPWLLEMAGDSDQPDRAARTWRLARDLWHRLDHPDAADRVARRLPET